MPVFIPSRPRGVAVGGVEGSTTGEVVPYGNSAMNKLKPHRSRPGAAGPNDPVNRLEAEVPAGGPGERTYTNR
jgi:hypothetical protein